ncbi:hypothetical protein BDV96DRAFT_649747 [Lophiotrema nucula]|uniref:Endoplasmic reticulum junction formation protein lunapark n=1 Tax=Lophiotrema nucula TaxID=690887 RepID=A0A6A5YX57_9PLEO|nr:hypothetical protein BDV96DRAFT_649747 [Lophiotrema nucula]
MVSLWPFKSGEDAASFEKTLSTLSTKISKATASNDVLRQRSRRVRVMWTLYAGFAYILAALLLIFVTGWRSWGATEISVVAGGPVVIYLVRTSLTTYYDYRISNTQTYLQKLQKDRDATIERLKAATKYNSTQQLLEKYGSSPKLKESPSRKKSQGPQKPAQPQAPRTGIPPPPTANIPRPQNQPPHTPQRPPSTASSPVGPSSVQALPPQSPESPTAEFAPNAFSQTEVSRQYSASAPSTFTQHHWYDRILDVLLGEDETQAKNRLALICSECRLVNGQAPPGARSLEDVGRWRCGGCRAWNGEERVEEDVVSKLTQGWEEERKAREKDHAASAEGGIDSDNRETEDDSALVAGTDEGSGVDLAEESVDETPPARSTRSKAKAKSKK